MKELTASLVFRCLNRFYPSSKEKLLERLFEGDFPYTNSAGTITPKSLPAGAQESDVFNGSNLRPRWNDGVIANPDILFQNMYTVVRAIRGESRKGLLNELKSYAGKEPELQSLQLDASDDCALIAFALFMYAVGLPENELESRVAPRNRVKSARSCDNGERQSKKNGLHEIIHKNSREEHSRLQGLLKYKVESELVSGVDCDIAEYNHILLVGDGGAGKTSFLLDYWGKLLSSDSAETQSLPIYVPLNRFEGNDKSFIRDYIQEQYFKSIDALGFDKWVKSAENCNVILLLDAINEAKNSRELGSEIEVLCSLGCKIIITSRHEMEGWVSLESFKRIHLLPLSEKIVDEQLRNRELEVSKRLRPLLTKPMYLALVLEIGEEAKSVEFPGELFLAHHKWIKKMFSVDKHGPAYHKQGERLLSSALPNLAAQTKSMVFYDTEVTEIFKAENVRCDPDEALAILCETGIIIDEGYDEYEAANVYRWKHEFFLQFYQAMRIWQQMGYSTEKRTFQAIKNLPQELLQRDIDDHVLAFLGDVLESQFEGKTSITSPMSPIEKWLQDNCKSQAVVSKQHTDSEIQICTANLVKTMILARDGYLEHTIFDGLDLQKVEFYDCWLTGSSFSKCRNVNQGNFYAAGHKTPPKSFAVSLKRNLLFSSSKGESVIYVWDLSTSKVIKTLNCQECVSSVSISPDERWLACALSTEPPTIKVFDLDLLTANTEQTAKMLCADYHNMDSLINIAPPGLVFFDSQSRILFCFSPEIGFCKRWDIATGVELDGFSLCPDYAMYNKLFYSTVDKYRVCAVTDKLIALRRSDIGIYNIRTGQEERTIKPQTAIRDISVTPNGERLIALDIANNSSTIYVYGLIDGIADYSISSSKARMLLGITATDEAICGTPHILSILNDNRCSGLFTWDFANQGLESPKIIQDVTSHCVYAIPNTNKVICISSDTHILIVDLSANEQQLLLGHGTGYYSTNVYFTSLKNILVRWYEDGDVFLLDMNKKTSSKVRKLSEFLHTKQFTDWSFRFDGQYLFVSWNYEETVIWDVVNDEYKDTVPASSVIVITGHNRDIVIAQHEDICFSAWRIPGHQLLGRFDESAVQAYFSEKISTVHAEADCKNHRVSTYCLLPEHTSVALGFYDGFLRIWDIISGNHFEKKISNVPLRQIGSVPNSSCICVVAENGVVSLYDLTKRHVVSQWNALDRLYAISGISKADKKSNQLREFSVRPISNEISILGYTLDFGGQECYFVKHLEYGLDVGGPFALWNPDSELLVSQNGKTALNPLATELMSFEVYDIPEVAWSEKHNSMQDYHYDISQDGQQVLCAFKNGDIAVYDVKNHSKFMWIKSDTIDLSGCDFRNSSNLDDDLKTFLQMNDAII